MFALVVAGRNWGRGIDGEAEASREYAIGASGGYEAAIGEQALPREIRQIGCFAVADSAFWDTRCG